MTETAPNTVRAWTPDPHRVAEASIAVLDAGDSMLTLLERLEGMTPSGLGLLAVRILRAESAWRTASRLLLDRLNDDEDEVLL